MGGNMSRIEWNDSMNIGIGSIDEQHKKLVDALNQLNDAVHEDSPSYRIEYILDFLLEYVRSHFRYEETLFEDYGFPNQDAHIAEHRAFSHRILEMNEIFRTGGGIKAADLVRTLSNWIRDHIERSDREYIPYLENKVPPAP
jgi:hemerythrin